MGDLDYIFAVARIRVKEKSLLSDADIRHLIGLPDAKTAAADKADRAATNASKSATRAASAAVPGGAAVSKAADKAQDAAYKARSTARQEAGEMEKRAAGASDGKRFSLDDKIRSLAANKGMAIIKGRDAVKGITDLLR